MCAPLLALLTLTGLLPAAPNAQAFVESALAGAPFEPAADPARREPATAVPASDTALRASAADVAQLSALGTALDEFSAKLGNLSERVAARSSASTSRFANLVAAALRIREWRRAREAVRAQLLAEVYGTGATCSGPLNRHGFYEPRADCRVVHRSEAAIARLQRMDMRYNTQIGHTDKANASVLLLRSMQNRHALESLRVSEHLTRGTCRRMLFDREHAFSAMWGIPRVKMEAKCAPSPALFSSWAADMNAGAMCDRSWYEGTLGCSGQSVIPRYTAPAPALLGFDLHIIRACNLKNGCGSSLAVPGPQACIRANLIILALFGRNPSYNMCRNLEWVVCAARGLLKGQANATLVFAPSPAHLTVMELWRDSRQSAAEYSVGRGERCASSLCKCPCLPCRSPWLPDIHPRRAHSAHAARCLQMKSVYVLESCLLATLCDNGDDLFKLRPMQPFVCQYNASVLEPLIRALLSPKGHQPL